MRKERKQGQHEFLNKTNNLKIYNNNKLQGGAGKAKNDCARKKNYFSTNHNSSYF